MSKLEMGMVGGEERLDGEFGDGHVEWRAKGRHSAEEGEFPACVAEAEGHDDVTGSGDLDLGFGFVAGVGA